MSAAQGKPLPAQSRGGCLDLYFRLSGITDGDCAVGDLPPCSGRWRVLEFAVRGFALLFRRILNLSGAASLGAAANIFLGMTESPVLIRPRLPTMSRSDLFLIIDGRLLHCRRFGDGDLCQPAFGHRRRFAAGHILTASLISVPAAVLLARLMHPQDETEEQANKEKVPVNLYHSSMDALTTGVSDGVRLFVNIIAMLLVFTAIVALINFSLAAAGEINGAALSVERVGLGLAACAPLVLAGPAFPGRRPRPPDRSWG